jgi:hypothetical protein
MAKFRNFYEIFPVTLAQSVHIHKVLALYFICLPIVIKNIEPCSLLELFFSQIRHSMFIL